jgi:hypothetical protein
MLFFFSFKTIYDMSYHLLTKLELKAKTSVAQTGSQPYEYAKGLSFALLHSTCSQIINSKTNKCLSIQHTLFALQVRTLPFNILKLVDMGLTSIDKSKAIHPYYVPVSQHNQQIVTTANILRYQHTWTTCWFYCDT